MGHRSTIVVSLVVLGRAASAAPTPPYAIVSDGGGFARQLVPATATTGLARSRTLYLNHKGVTLTPGNNDSEAQTSTIVSEVRQVPGWAASPADWAATVSCMQDVWSRFDVTVTDVDPGATPHLEALFGGAPADLGLTSNIGGISPFTSDCSIIEKSIVFAFTDSLPRVPRTICEVMSQEIAHSYGLDHELLASDPMTYLPYSGDRAFQDQAVACGESKERPCGISGTACRASQNSYQLLLARVGAAHRDNTPPSVQITSPGESQAVTAGFMITATAADNVDVASVAFYLDGDLLATTTQAPYQLATDPTLTEGAHTIVVEATDGDGNATMEQREIMVTGDPSASAAGGCSAGGMPPLPPAVIALLAAQWRRRRERKRR